MKLYLAVAVLMLAFVAFTEAQDDTIEQKFSKFGEQVSEVGRNLAEKAKTTFEQVHNSDFAVNTRNWFDDLMSKLRTKVEEISQ
ncbi:apolipoprotein C-I [Enoplosus armatus]|uniref:apolipoprotein C-I n=1 Tax=Enoplosus armatus TaxID=215367 RepID=UPI0039966F3A